MHCHLAPNRVTLYDDEGTPTHRIRAKLDGGLFIATLYANDDSKPPKVVFACRTQSVFVTLARSYLEEVVAVDDDAIKRHYRQRPLKNRHLVAVGTLSA